MTFRSLFAARLVCISLVRSVRRDRSSDRRRPCIRFLSITILVDVSMRELDAIEIFSSSRGGGVSPGNSRWECRDNIFDRRSTM